MVVRKSQNPVAVNNWRRTEEEISRLAIGQILESEDRWRLIVEQMADEGTPPVTSTYQEMRDSLEGDRFVLEVPREAHIRREVEGMGVVFDLLVRRNWSVFRILNNATQFITSDRPVAIHWSNRENLRGLEAHEPGFGSFGTEVLFPLTKRTAVAGTFTQPEIVAETPLYAVALANTKIIRHAVRQIFSASRDFPYIGLEGGVRYGTDLFDTLHA